MPMLSFVTTGSAFLWVGLIKIARFEPQLNYAGAETIMQKTNLQAFCMYSHLSQNVIVFINPAQVTSAEFGQTVLLLKLKIS